MTRVIACALALLALPALAAPARADPVVIGRPADSDNCFPFGCGRGDLDAANRYQQVYASSQFAGPIRIAEVQFYFSAYAGRPLTVGTYEFYLSTTSRAVDGLDNSNFDSNSGPDRSQFAIVPLTGRPAPHVLSIAGAPFLYNPAAGNLLLDIVIPGGAVTGPGPDVAFAEARNGTAHGLFSRAHNFGSGTAGYGLVTGFSDASPVPEPATMMLIGVGLAATALRARRRNEHV
jgi:PEP-CTERM motif